MTKSLDIENLRNLSLDDIKKIEKIVNPVGYTIKHMSSNSTIPEKATKMENQREKVYKLKPAKLDNQRLKFEEHYEYLESEFMKIIRLIPLENTPKTYSPKLYSLLQDTCSQIDGILRLVKTSMNLTVKKNDAWHIFKELDCDALSNQTITMFTLPHMPTIKPFLCPFKCIRLKHD